MGLFWEIYQFRRIADADRRARSGTVSIAQLTTQIEELERQVDRLLAINQAMFSLLQDRNGFTEADLGERMAQLAAQESSIKSFAIACPNCGHDSPPLHGKCLYCGHQIAADSPFSMR